MRTLILLATLAAPLTAAPIEFSGQTTARLRNLRILLDGNQAFLSIPAAVTWDFQYIVAADDLSTDHIWRQIDTTATDTLDLGGGDFFEFEFSGSIDPGTEQRNTPNGTRKAWPTDLDGGDVTLTARLMDDGTLYAHSETIVGAGYRNTMRFDRIDQGWDFGQFFPFDLGPRTVDYNYAGSSGGGGGASFRFRIPEPSALVLGLLGACLAGVSIRKQPRGN